MARWRIVVSRERLAEVQEDTAFAELLVLARMCNALRFALSAGFDAAPGVVGERQRIASFFQTAANLSEILQTLPRMGQHFRNLPAFGELITPLLKDESAVDLRSKVLKWLRDKAVSHHDKDVIPIGLAALTGGPWTFAEGDSDSYMGVSYPLADFATIRAPVAQIDDGGNLVETFERVLRTTVELGVRSLTAVESLIGQALNDRGFLLDEE